MKQEKKATTPQHGHHRIVPVALITLGIPTAIAVVFLLVANILFHDEQPPNDAALRITDRIIADEQNGFFDIQRIDADVASMQTVSTEPLSDDRVDALLRGGAWDQEFVTTISQTYAVAIDDFRAAAKKDLYQDPLTAQPEQLDVTKFPNLSNVRFVAKLVTLQGINKAMSGDVPGGVAEIVDVLHVGQLMESQQQTIIEWLVGSSTKQIGLTALRILAQQTTLTSDQAQAISLAIDVERGTTDGVVSALKTEYAYSRAYGLKQMDLGELFDGYYMVTDTEGNSTPRSTLGNVLSALDQMGVTRFYYWPNQNWRFLVDRRVQDLQEVQVDCAHADLSIRQPEQYSRRTGWGRLIESNSIGKMYADMGNVSFGGLTTRLCNEHLAMSATQAIVALNAYRHDAGSLPASLDVLVPKYLAAAPIDPYNGQELHYNAEKKIVYSVGSNRIDEQGNTANDGVTYMHVDMPWDSMLDPTFSVTP
jgi:hypothetical protein